MGHFYENGLKGHGHFHTQRVTIGKAMAHSYEAAIPGSADRIVTLQQP
jgi:hypothetical protein